MRTGRPPKEFSQQVTFAMYEGLELEVFDEGIGGMILHFRRKNRSRDFRVKDTDSMTPEGKEAFWQAVKLWPILLHEFGLEVSQ